jgi:hypothetical protein
MPGTYQRETGNYHWEFRINREGHEGSRRKPESLINHEGHEGHEENPSSYNHEQDLPISGKSKDFFNFIVAI